MTPAPFSEVDIMSCKANIYVANTTPTAVIAGNTLPLGSTPIRRYNQCAVDTAGNSIALKECGYYLVNINATFTVPVAGTVTLQLLNNNVAVPGATASRSVTTDTTEVDTLSFSAIVRVFNGSAPGSLTILNNGVAATFSNIAVNVVKIV